MGIAFGVFLGMSRFDLYMFKAFGLFGAFACFKIRAAHLYPPGALGGAEGIEPLTSTLRNSRLTIYPHRLEIKDIAKRKELSIISEYSDEGIFGAKGRHKGTGFGTLIKGAVKKEFDIILV